MGYIFEGFFVDGVLQGNGRIHHELKEINFVGMIQNGKMNGFGKDTYHNSTYIGDFVNN